MNTVIGTAELESINASTIEIITATALLYFKENSADVVILEGTQSDKFDPINICSPKIVALTRITEADKSRDEDNLEKAIERITSGLAQPKSWVVSADQSKITLQAMGEITKANDANWAMPIRKLVPLAYPLEQLHGRCAALAERVAQLYAEKFVTKDSIVVSNSLVIKPKGRRGRPTLEAKKQAKLNPKRTIEKFWQETVVPMANKFQLMDKEKPAVLLDSASNVDAMQNLLLGVRLLNYKHPIKGIALVIGCNASTMNSPEFMRSVRYFFKKTAGQMFLCPINDSVQKHEIIESWDLEIIAKDVQSLKVKVKVCGNFASAFEAAKKSVDERHGLIVVSGSQAIVSEYLKYKNCK